MKHALSYLAVATLMSAFVPVAKGVTVDDAISMIRRGDTAEALAALDSIIAAKPKDAAAHLAKGDCLVAMSRDSDAVTAYKNANRHGSNDALLRLADIDIRRYRTDEAEANIESYKSYIKKNPRKKLTDQSAESTERLSRTRALLDRVEAVTVIDSLTVDAADFFSHYRLSPEAGTILPPESLPQDLGAVSPSSAYLTEDNRSIIWVSEDNDGNYRLMSSDRLVGGGWDEPAAIGDHLGGGVDANYPFLMPDGVTLYYASDREGGLGGYDIYMTRRGADGYLQPQNVGMPYNSPYDDYLLAIDEESGLGWWATDRNRIPGKVTIYIFAPAETRVNIPFDAPDLADRAMLTSIGDTWASAPERDNLLKRLDTVKRKATPDKTKATADFEFVLPDGRVITSADGLPARAADRLEQYLNLEAQYRQTQSRLTTLRESYSRGDRSVASQITDLERDVLNLQQRLKRMSNEVIKAL